MILVTAQGASWGCACPACMGDFGCGAYPSAPYAAFAGFWGWGVFSALVTFPGGGDFSFFVAVAVICPAFSFFAVVSFFGEATFSLASLGGRPFRFGGSGSFTPFSSSLAAFCGASFSGSFTVFSGAAASGVFCAFPEMGEPSA